MVIEIPYWLVVLIIKKRYVDRGIFSGLDLDESDPIQQWEIPRSITGHSKGGKLVVIYIHNVKDKQIQNKIMQEQTRKQIMRDKACP